MTAPLTISVVTPSFNQGRFIRKNIESVLEQRLDGVEHIVADGGSSDETIGVLKEYSHLRWISEKDHGQSDALNKGIAMARGDWIAWVNSDDYLLPGALAKLAAFVAQRPGAQFVYSNCLFTDEGEVEVGRHKANYSLDGFYYWWRGAANFPQPGSFFKKELWEKLGPFDVNLHYTMDYDFWLKLSGNVEFHYLDDWLVAYRLHGESKTGRGNLPFFKEKIAVTRRYWDARGGWRRWQFRFLLHLAYGRQLMLEGIRRWEAGRKGKAWRLWIESYARNPLCLFAYPHLCFRFKQLVGDRLYKRLREWRRGPGLGTK